MKQPRRLSLKSESLAELTTEDLSAIAGAQQAATQDGVCLITQGYGLCSIRCQMTFNTCDC